MPLPHPRPDAGAGAVTPVRATITSGPAADLDERRPARSGRAEVGPPGLVHADFYADNWMVADGRLVAVLDWEGAHRSDGRVDVGWIAMMYDRASRHPAQRPDIAAAPEPEELMAGYGAPPADVAWFRALAALTAHYLQMHRSGQRPDATWEGFGRSVPYTLERAVELLG